jgi:hypothetical protein
VYYEQQFEFLKFPGSVHTSSWYDGSKLKRLKSDESSGVEVDCWEGIQQRKGFELNFALGC